MDLMSGKSFSLEFKLAALGQIDEGESVARVARDFGVSRKTIYQWRDQLRQGEESSDKPSERVSYPELPAELVRARERIAELERKIGQQQVELDFFRGALRRIEASHRPSDGPGGTESSPRSRR
jgi:transposase-like protein